MASEASVQRDVWIELARRPIARATLFRTNSGKAWLSGAGPARRMADGSVLVPAARPVGLGLAMVNGDTVPGLSDLTGWTLITITPDMVGRVLPVFTTIETKASAGGRRRDNQINFVAQVQAAGGIAGFASSARQANEIIDAWLRGDTPDPL
jgi:hypothetical protein